MKKSLIPVVFLIIHVICLGQRPSDHGRFGALLWKYRTDGKIFSSPVSYRHLILFGSEDKYLYALNATTGALAWKFKTGGPVHGSPAIQDDKVFFTSWDGNFYAVNAGSGKLLWKFRTRGEKRAGAKGLWGMKPVAEYMDDPFDFFLSSPTTDPGAGLVYFGSWDRYLYAVDSRTGKEKWKFQTQADTAIHLLEGIQASPLVYDGHVFLGARDGYFYALDAATGQLTWKYSANSSWILTTATAKDHVIYTGTSDSYLLLALDEATGKEKFRTKANGYVYSSPAIAANTVYFGDFTGQLLAVDRLSGEIMDRFETPGRLKNADSILNKGQLDFAYMTKGKDLADYTTTVIGMDKLYMLGPILTRPVVDKGVIYFGSADGYLYAVRLTQQ